MLSGFCEEYRYAFSHWLWRPAWYWPEVSRDEGIKEVKEPWVTKTMEWVFCEDLSRFIPVEHAREFYAEVLPPFLERYVFDRSSTEARSYMMEVGKGDPVDFDGVEYVPPSAFDY